MIDEPRDENAKDSGYVESLASCREMAPSRGSKSNMIEDCHFWAAASFNGL